MTDPTGAVYLKGILGDPLDIDGDPRARRRPHPVVEARPGLSVEARGTGVRGTIVSIGKGQVTLRGRDGRDRAARLVDGGFNVDGRQVTLVAPTSSPSSAPVRTASGSVAVKGAPARIARAGRILVEGVHDAELVEKVWGDDLRFEGVVVELLDGADNLIEVVNRFGPRPGRRLGVLLDHVVDGSKESRLAAQIASNRVTGPFVLITGHPFVDIWAAIQPRVVGVDAWPDVPKGEVWKDGVCRRLGIGDATGFWKRLRNAVGSYADLRPELVGAVEQLIDFVTTPDA